MSALQREGASRTCLAQVHPLQPGAWRAAWLRSAHYIPLLPCTNVPKLTFMHVWLNARNILGERVASNLAGQGGAVQG